MNQKQDFKQRTDLRNKFVKTPNRNPRNDKYNCQKISREKQTITKIPSK